MFLDQKWFHHSLAMLLPFAKARSDAGDCAPGRRFRATDPGHQSYRTNLVDSTSAASVVLVCILASKSEGTSKIMRPLLASAVRLLQIVFLLTLFCSLT